MSRDNRILIWLALVTLIFNPIGWNTLGILLELWARFRMQAQLMMKTIYFCETLAGIIDVDHSFR